MVTKFAIDCDVLNYVRAPTLEKRVSRITKMPTGTPQSHTLAQFKLLLSRGIFVAADGTINS